MNHELNLAQIPIRARELKWGQIPIRAYAYELVNKASPIWALTQFQRTPFQRTHPHRRPHSIKPHITHLPMPPRQVSLVPLIQPTHTNTTHKPNNNHAPTTQATGVAYSRCQHTKHQRMHQLAPWPRKQVHSHRLRTAKEQAKRQRHSQHRCAQAQSAL